MSSERLSDSDSENDEYIRSQSLSCVESPEIPHSGAKRGGQDDPRLA